MSVKYVHSAQGLQPVRAHPSTGLNASLQPTATGAAVAKTIRRGKPAVQLSTAGLGRNIRTM